MSYHFHISNSPLSSKTRKNPFAYKKSSVDAEQTYQYQITVVPFFIVAVKKLKEEKKPSQSPIYNGKR